MPPASLLENTTSGVSTKSAVTIWPPPMFELERSMPLPASSRSCIRFFMARPRSTTTKQLDCWIIIRIRPTGDGRP